MRKGGLETQVMCNVQCSIFTGSPIKHFWANASEHSGSVCFWLFRTNPDYNFNYTIPLELNKTKSATVLCSKGMLINSMIIDSSPSKPVRRIDYKHCKMTEA